MKLLQENIKETLDWIVLYQAKQHVTEVKVCRAALQEKLIYISI